MPVRCQRKLAPNNPAGFGRRETYHDFRFLHVDYNDLKPRALTGFREQMRPTAQPEERMHEEVLHT
jgi:hypothetical protein